MPFINVSISISHELEVVTALVPSPYIAICNPVITMTATIIGSPAGHTFLWTQTGGTPVVWDTPQNMPVVTFTQPGGPSYDTSTKFFEFTIDGVQIFPVTVYGSPTEIYSGVGFATTIGLPTESYNWQPGSKFNQEGIPAQLATGFQFSPSVAPASPFGVAIQNPSSFNLLWNIPSDTTGFISSDLLENSTGVFTLNTTLPTSDAVGGILVVTGLPYSPAITFRIRSNYNLGKVESSASTNSFFPTIPNNLSITDVYSGGMGASYGEYYNYNFTNFTLINRTETDDYQGGVGAGYGEYYNYNFTNFTLINRTETDDYQGGVGASYGSYYNYSVIAGGINVGG